jgi:hypothetical protein
MKRVCTGNIGGKKSHQFDMCLWGHQEGFQSGG